MSSESGDTSPDSPRLTLQKVMTLITHIEDDFDLNKIAGSGQCFRWEKINDNTFRIPHRGSCLRISDLGGGDYEADCTEEEFSGIWSNYFDLAENYRKIRSMIDPEEDPFLFRAAEQEKGIRILRQDPWEMLISFIISQNKNIPAIRNSVFLLAEACGEPEKDKMGRPFYAFPTAEAVAALGEEDLKKCRLGYRCRYVHEAAKAVASGKIDLGRLAAAGEKSALAELTALYGVGVKVASCVQLFGLHDMDSFPRDVWINRVLENEYPKGYPFEKYSPYNGVFQQYMFAYYRDKK